MGAGPFHSQCPESWFFHVPGLRIVAPSNPMDAKGLLISAIDDPNPVLFFEHKGLYRGFKGNVPINDYHIEIGKANIVQKGTDLSIICYGLAVHWAIEAGEILAEDGINIEIIDLRTLLPWDKDCVQKSIQKTGRAQNRSDSAGERDPRDSYALRSRATTTRNRDGETRREVTRREVTGRERWRRGGPEPELTLPEGSLNGLHVALFRRNPRKGPCRRTPVVFSERTRRGARSCYLATLRGRQLSSGDRERLQGGGGGEAYGQLRRKRRRRREKTWKEEEQGGRDRKEGRRHRRFGEKARVDLGDCEWLTFLGCRWVGA